MSMTEFAPADELDPADAEGMDTAPTADEQDGAAWLLAQTRTVNIAEELEEDELSRIGQQVLREFEIDDESRSEWMERSRTALDLAMQVAKTKTFPWPNCSNIVYPLMTTAAIRFQAQAYPAIVSDRGIVKGVVVGSDEGVPEISPEDGTPLIQMGEDGQPQGPVWETPPGEKRRRADRIGDHMSWQLLEEMESWEEDTDKLLLILPIAGCAFRKTFFDPGLGYNCSDLVPAQNLVINYWAKSMERAPRISEIVEFYPHEIEENVRNGLWLDHDYGMQTSEESEHPPSGDDEDAPHEFIEQHRRLDLDGDGYAEPYIVTEHRATAKVARIVARFDEDGVKVGSDGRVIRIAPVHYYTKYDFMPSPEGAIYGVGFGQLLGPINAAVNATINQMIDAGTQQNAGGGFIGRNLSMKGGNIRFKMGEYVPVNAPGQAIRDNIVSLEHKGPSLVLFQLLGFLVDAGREIAATKDILTGEARSAEMSPTTVLALIEQGMKVFTAIYKRIYRAAKKEYEKLYRLNRIYMEDDSGYRKNGEWTEVTRADYEQGSGVVPVSDPSMVSKMQEMARAQFLMQFRPDPLMNPVEINRRVLEAAQIEDVDDLFAKEQAPDPRVVAEAAKMKLEVEKLRIESDNARVEQIKDMAQAVKYLAEADKANGAQSLAETTAYISALKAEFDIFMARRGPEQQPVTPGVPQQ